MGISQSALSYTVRMLEQRLQIKLLERTTRSVSTTAAGEALRQKIEPLIAGIREALNDINTEQGRLGGTLRINGNAHSLNYVLRDRLLAFAQAYPEVRLEIIGEDRFSDIVQDRFDMGIRLGNNVAKDMIAVRVSQDLIMQAAAARLPRRPRLPSHPLRTKRIPTARLPDADAGKPDDLGIPRPQTEENRQNPAQRCLYQQPEQPAARHGRTRPRPRLAAVRHPGRTPPPRVSRQRTR